MQAHLPQPFRSFHFFALTALSWVIAFVCLAPTACPALADNAEAMAISHTREYELVWHRFLANPIYLTTSLSRPAGMVFAGDYLNEPKQVEAISFIGTGEPDWVLPGTELYTDAAREADVLAALDCAGTDSSVTVMEWRSASSTPLWAYELHPCRPLTGEGWSQGKGIQVSDDGSTIAAVVNMYAPDGLNARLVIFTSGSSAPIAVYDVVDGTASALQITPDGRFIAIYAWPYIYVYDRANNCLRWSGSAGSGNDALAISGDGRYIAWGWSSLFLREWNGSSYQPLWTTSQSGYYLTECALSPDESRLVLAWYRGTTFDDSIIEMYDLPAHTRLWAYSYQPVQAERPTDVVSELVFSPDGEWFVAPSWGGFFPELHVFRTDESEPVLIFDTPGTMFDADILNAPGGRAWVTACGKHVHAGQSGRGGDLYAIAIQGSAHVNADPATVKGSLAWLNCSPNPLRDCGRIEWRLTEPVHTRVAVVDLQGRAIATLFETFAASGEHSVVWNGLDSSGRKVAPGVYLLTVTAGDAVQSRAMRVLR